MRKAVVSLAFVFMLAGSAMAQQRFVAYFTGAQEVPAVSSPGQGTCKFVLNAAETGMTMQCTYSGLTSPAIGAHIHGLGGPGTNAPILLDVGPVSGTSGVINFNVTLNAGAVAAMRAHQFYVNIHTSNFPNGEIRGQIKQVHTVFDNDGDGRTDVAIFRQSSNQFWALNSVDGSVYAPIVGTGADIWTNGTWDFDADGRGDIVLFSVNASNVLNWRIFQTTNNTVRSVDFGNTGLGDTLAPADYDGDGAQDVGIFRRSTGDWWYIESSTGSVRTVHWGIMNDFPAVGDYTGDGKADHTVVRSEGGNWVWYIRDSTTGTMRRDVFGLNPGDTVFFFAPADVDGDGKQDLRVLRNVGGQKHNYFLRSSDGGLQLMVWGLSTDTSFFGDYDGDGKTDMVARRNNAGSFDWYILRSSDGALQFVKWGLTGDQLAESEELERRMMQSQ